MCFLSGKCLIFKLYELPNGVKQKKEGELYEGYVGNEAVVSPVTGILLEYGEYDGEIDSVSGEEYRTNVDFKYSKNGNASEEASTTGNEEKASKEGENGNSKKTTNANAPVDHVGYTKILVLDKKAYAQLEKEFGGNTEFGKDSLKNEKELKDWSDEQKTIYGYKEFAETYETAGIAGNIIYIDGFKCEYPDEKAGNESEKNSSNDKESSTDSNSTDASKSEDSKKSNDSNKNSDFIPDGEDITIDTFKSITKDSISNKKGEELQSLYEPDEEFNMPSKNATDKLNAERKIKEEAKSSIYTNNKIKVQITENGEPVEYDGIFLKEGTVIGRTITDKELTDVIRNGKYGSYEELRGEGANKTQQENQDGQEQQEGQILGNYLRMIMLDKNRDQVENIEDYIKLDDGEEEDTSNVDVDLEFFYWLPYESGPIGEAGKPTDHGAGACGTVSGPSEVACGIAQWTTYGGTNNIAPLCKWLSTEDPTLCGPLGAFKDYSSSQIIGSLSSLQSAWKEINEKDTDKFLELQMKYFYEVEYKKWLEDKNVQWLTDKKMVTQGTFASLMNWYPANSWEKNINSSMSDEEICRVLLKEACNYGSTMGGLGKRWNSQYVLARDLLNGSFTDIEGWMKTKQPAKYTEGQNPGALGFVRQRKYFTTRKELFFADIKKTMIV